MRSISVDLHTNDDLGNVPVGSHPEKLQREDYGNTGPAGRELKAR
jgi:hypothetical protein